MDRCPTMFVECDRCGGLGEYDIPHPLWGSRNCPEAYVNQKCPDCDGTGKIEIDVEDDDETPLDDR